MHSSLGFFLLYKILIFTGKRAQKGRKEIGKEIIEAKENGLLVLHS